MVLVEESEERPPRVAVLPGDLLARGFAEYWSVFVVEVVVLYVAYVFVIGKVRLSATMCELIPRGAWATNHSNKHS